MASPGFVFLEISVINTIHFGCILFSFAINIILIHTQKIYEVTGKIK